MHQGKVEIAPRNEWISFSFFVLLAKSQKHSHLISMTHNNTSIEWKVLKSSSFQGLSTIQHEIELISQRELPTLNLSWKELLLLENWILHYRTFKNWGHWHTLFFDQIENGQKGVWKLVHQVYTHWKVDLNLLGIR